MRKLIYGILVFTTFALTGIALAAPTSTIVQNLFITGQKSSGSPCLTINSAGFVSTSTCGGASISFPIPYASTTGIQADLQSAYVISWNGATGTVLYNPFPIPFASTTGVQAALNGAYVASLNGATGAISGANLYNTTTTISAGSFLSVTNGGVGATQINLNITPVSSTRAISAGLGLSGGGDLSADRTLTLNMAGVTCLTGHINFLSATGTATCTADTGGTGISSLNGSTSSTQVFATSGPVLTITTANGTHTFTISTSSLGLKTTDIVEGTGLYFTDTRARAVWNQDLYSTSSPTFGQLTVSATSTFPSGIWNSLGNVGIGATGPVAKLEVTGAADAPSITAQSGIFRISSGPSAVTGLNVGIQSTSPYGTYLQSTNQPDTGGSAFPLLLNPLGGNIGIGTTNPTFTGSSISSPLGLELSNTAPTFRLTRTGTGARSFSQEIDSNGFWYLNDDTAGAGKERITVDTSGNVGIGTTGPGSKLDVNGTVRLGNAVTDAVSIGVAPPTISSINQFFVNKSVDISGQAVVGGESDFSHNFYYNSGNRYRLSDYASQIQQTLGNINFNTAASGTADAALSWSTKMTILQNGNVGLGTTTPAAQLTVSSTAATQAPLNLQPMVLPTSLNNGDIVVDTTSNNLTTRISGQTLYGQQVIYSQVNSISLRGTGTLANMLDLSGKGTTTLAANLLVAGKQVRITMNGFFSSPAAATSTLTWDVRVGTTSVIYATTSVPGNAAQNSFTLSGTFTTRTTGNAGTIMPAGMVQMWTTSSSAATSTWQTLPTNAAVTLSTLIPQNVVFNMKFTSGNSPVYSATSTNATIEILN